MLVVINRVYHKHSNEFAFIVDVKVAVYNDAEVIGSVSFDEEKYRYELFFEPPLSFQAARPTQSHAI
jgi:hypothetical protein